MHFYCDGYKDKPHRFGFGETTRSYDKRHKDGDYGKLNMLYTYKIVLDLREEFSEFLINLVQKLVNDKKIDGYPSIWMVKGDQVIEYSAKPDVNSLTEFINTML